MVASIIFSDELVEKWKIGYRAIPYFFELGVEAILCRLPTNWGHDLNLL